MRIIDNFFINHKLRRMSRPVKTLDMKEMGEIDSVLILWPQTLRSSEMFITAVRSIAEHYHTDPVVMIPAFYNLYSKICKKTLYDIKMPLPTKFSQLERVENIRKTMGSIDLYYDFSQYDMRIRAMIRRTLRPDISVSFKQNSMESDYNILVSAGGDPLKLLEMTGIPISVENTADMLRNMKKNTRYSTYDHIVIGRAFGIRRRAEQLMKSSASVLYIDDLGVRLDDKILFAIADAPEIITDSENRDNADFIREIFK